MARAWTSASRFGQTAGPLIAGGLLKVVSTSVVLGLGSVLGIAIVILGVAGPFARSTGSSAPADAW